MHEMNSFARYSQMLLLNTDLSKEEAQVCCSMDIRQLALLKTECNVSSILKFCFDQLEKEFIAKKLFFNCNLFAQIKFRPCQ
jgi:hypothetical protein